ncbi:MAG: hypothetical protein GY719_36895, partial [bacterium]|nr:hypothetical protein [bacterium]
MSDLDRAEAPAGVLALALALGLMACGSASPDCPDDIQTLFREQKPHVELLACEETRPGVRPGEIQEQVTFTFEYRYFPGGKSRFDVWTYDLLGNGELRPHSSGEIVFVDLPSDTVRNGEAADATTYRFTISELSAATDETTESTGRAWASGEMFRVQYENKEKSHIVVSSGAGSPTFAVDPESKTYHDLDAHTASALDMSPWQKSRIEDLATELEETDDSKMIRGWSARRHVLRVSFTVATDYGSEVAKERFEATLSLWTAP